MLLIGMSSLARHPEIHFFPVEALPPKWWGTFSSQYPANIPPTTTTAGHLPCALLHSACLGILADSSLLPCAPPLVPSLLQSQSRGLRTNMGSSIIDIQRDSTWLSVEYSLWRLRLTFLCCFIVVLNTIRNVVGNDVGCNPSSLPSMTAADDLPLDSGKFWWWMRPAES